MDFQIEMKVVMILEAKAPEGLANQMAGVEEMRTSRQALEGGAEEEVGMVVGLEEGGTGMKMVVAVVADLGMGGVVMMLK